MVRPPWRYSSVDDQLRMVRSEVDSHAEMLCARQVLITELEEPGADDQRGCAGCVRVLALKCLVWTVFGDVG